jgi:5,6-dimethylbenzimidazole synthase
MIQIDEFLELVKKRRSIRRFKPDPVPDEYILKILEAARWAMSGANAQPWEFIVVKKPETKEKLANAIHEQRKMEYRMELTRIDELRHPGSMNFKNSRPTFAEAPVLIVVCGDRRTLTATVISENLDPGEGGAGGAYIKNMANATQNIQLAAAALGLGSCWLSVAKSVECVVKTILGVPEAIEVHTIVPVGYPAYEPPPGYRRAIGELVHYEKYDSSKFRSLDDIIKQLVEIRKKAGPGYEKAVRQ